MLNIVFEVQHLPLTALPLCVIRHIVLCVITSQVIV